MVRLVLLGLILRRLCTVTSSPTQAPTSLPTVLCDNFTLGGSWSGGKSRYLGDFIYKGLDYYNNPYYQSYQCVGDRSRFYEPQAFYIAYRPKQMVEDKRMWVLTKSPLLDEGNTSDPLPLYWRAESNMVAPPLIGLDKWEYYNGHDQEWKLLTTDEVSVTCLWESRECVKDPKIRWRLVIICSFIAVVAILIICGCCYEHFKVEEEKGYLDPSSGHFIMVMNDKLGYHVQMEVKKVFESKNGVTLVKLACSPDETTLGDDQIVDLKTYHRFQVAERALLTKGKTSVAKKPSFFARMLDPSTDYFEDDDEEKASGHTLPTGFFFTSAASANAFDEEVVERGTSKKKQKKKKGIKIPSVEAEKKDKQKRIQELAAKRKKLMQETFKGDHFITPEESALQAKASKPEQYHTKPIELVSSARNIRESQDDFELVEGDFESGTFGTGQHEGKMLSNKERMHSALQRREEKTAKEKAEMEKLKNEQKMAKLLNLQAKRKKKKKQKQEDDRAGDKFTSYVQNGPKPEPAVSAKASAPGTKSGIDEKPQADAEAKDDTGLFTGFFGTIM